MKRKISAVVCSLSLLAAGAACAQSDADLRSDGKNPDNVLTYGMGYSQNRYSALSQINKSNVKKLVPVWSDRKSTRLNSSH